MPESPQLSRYQRLKERFEAAGQRHVFAGWERLDETGREQLCGQLEDVDLDLLSRLIKEMRADSPIASLELERLEPAPLIPLATTPGGLRKENRAIAVGEDLLRAGKVASMIVAGGQGSRLGFDGPKGCFPIGPVSNCSLFEWHFAKIAAARARYAARIPALILTSRANHETTEKFLGQHDYFGLPHEDVLLFRQAMLPAVDFEGRLLMENDDELFLSPDGHGGSLAALAREGILDELDKRGIEHVFYFQVDNPLVKVLDPATIGHHAIARSEMTSKAVMKTDPLEKVGVFAKVGRRVGIVEYSDLPEDLARLTDDDGRLRYGAGNIAIHVMSVPFIRSLTAGGLKLPYHRARKAIAFMGPDGNRVIPDVANGVKFETFVFDALPKAKQAIIVEADRPSEFSPVKNATGSDSPHHARASLSELFRSWLREAGYSAPAEGAPVEISPKFALDFNEFQRKVRKERALDATRLLIG